MIYLTEEGLITNDPNVRVVCRVCDATRAGTNANWSAQEIAGFLLNTEALQRDKVMQLLSYEFQPIRSDSIRFFPHTSFWMDGRSSRHHRFICYMLCRDPHYHEILDSYMASRDWRRRMRSQSGVHPLPRSVAALITLQLAPRPRAIERGR